MFRNRIFVSAAILLGFLPLSCSFDRSQPLSVDLDEEQEEQLELTPANHPPVIEELTYGIEPTYRLSVEEIGGLALGQNVRIQCRATDPDRERLTFIWSASNGMIRSRSDRPYIVWEAPESPGPVTIIVEVSDSTDTVADTLFFEARKIGPRLTLVDSASFDFGYVPRRATVIHSFRFWSTGDDTLAVLDDDCFCDLTIFPTREITPHQGVTASITVSTDQFLGEVNETVSINSNDPSSPLQFDLSMNVVQEGKSTYPLVIKPWVQDLTRPDGNFDWNGDYVRFTISNKSNVLQRVKVVKRPGEVLVQFQSPEIPANGSIEALVFLRQGNNLFSYSSSFTIEVDDEDHTRYTIPVVRKVH